MQCDNSRPPESVIEAASRLSEAIRPCVLPIYARYNGELRQHATGTLFRFADSYFLITASHAIREYIEAKSYYEDIQLMLHGGADKLFPIGGEFAASKKILAPASHLPDPADIAIWKLDEQTFEDLGGARRSYLNSADIAPYDSCHTGWFLVQGFPCVDTDISIPNKTIQHRAFVWLAEPYVGSPQPRNFDAAWHLALTGPDEPQMRESLVGISGCSIWSIGEASSNSNWELDRARIVGIETHVDSNRRVIMGVRWGLAAILLVKAFPELVKAMQILLPKPS